MKKYNLGFISDVDFFNHVKDMVSRLTESIDLRKFSKNIIDPIKMTVEMHAYQISLEDAVAREIARQMGKTVENAIGWFHQNIFGYCKGWQIPKDGVDVMNDNMTIFADFKDITDPMNAEAVESVFQKLYGVVIANIKATAYLVDVKAKKSQNIPWAASGHSLSPSKAKRLRRISIDRFYEVATGDKQAFGKMRSILGMAIDDVLNECKGMQLTHTVLSDLKTRYLNVLKDAMTLQRD